jgi:hypothetical protein
MYDVKLDWESKEQGEGDLTIHSIVHDQTIYQFFNVSRNEATNRFQEYMNKRSDYEARLGSNHASGFTMKTQFNGGENLLWLNAGDEMRKLSDMLLGQIGQPEDNP